MADPLMAINFLRQKGYLIIENFEFHDHKWMCFMQLGPFQNEAPVNSVTGMARKKQDARRAAAIKALKVFNTDPSLCALPHHERFSDSVSDSDSESDALLEEDNGEGYPLIQVRHIQSTNPSVLTVECESYCEDFQRALEAFAAACVFAQTFLLKSSSNTVQVFCEDEMADNPFIKTLCGVLDVTLSEKHPSEVPWLLVGEDAAAPTVSSPAQSWGGEEDLTVE